MGKPRLYYLPLILGLFGIARAEQCQITSPLPVPVLLSGCTYSGSLPDDSTSYIRNTETLQSGTTFYVSSGTVTDFFMAEGQRVCLEDGTHCPASAGGDITAVSGGFGLTGGGDSGAVALAVVSTAAFTNRFNNFTSSQTFSHANGALVTYGITVGSITSGGLDLNTQLTTVATDTTSIRASLNTVSVATGTLRTDLNAVGVATGTLAAATLTNSSATATYLQLSSATATYLNKNQAVDTSAEVVALFTDCSGTQYLGADGACHDDQTGEGGGGGASTLAVTTGTSSGFTPPAISSPTAVLLADASVLTVALQGGATAFLSVNYSSITAQGPAPLLTQSSATATYLQLSSATATYLQLSSATATYAPRTENAATYLTQSSATATYLQTSSATATYIQTSSVTATYLQSSSATVTYFNRANVLAATNMPALTGDLTGSAGSLTVAVNDDSHAHTGTSLSGIDISDDTNLTAGDHITLTGDDLDVDDDYILNTGDVGTGVYDFGGATSFEIPNGAANTVDTTGEIAFDTTDGTLVAFDGVSANVVGFSTHCFSVNVSSGLGFNGLNEPIWTAPPDMAVTLTQIKATSLPAGTTVVYQLDEAASAFDSAGTDVFSILYSSGNYTTVTTNSFSNAEIAAGATLVLNCPATSATGGTPRTLYLNICFKRNRE